jgi:hypothetical protein
MNAQSSAGVDDWGMEALRATLNDLPVRYQVALESQVMIHEGKPTSMISLNSLVEFISAITAAEEDGDLPLHHRYIVKGARKLLARFSADPQYKAHVEKRLQLIAERRRNQYLFTN